jgi:hypothetical protein
VYAVAGWQCSLRGDRLERIENKKEKKKSDWNCH